MVDQGESVLAKLRNKARLTGKGFQLLIQLFCQEEFLRKVAHSKYKDNLILKGGLFLYYISGFEGRPTMDIDLMVKNLSNELHDIEEVIKQIISENTGNNFILFKIKSVQNITEQRDYHGVRVKIIAQIKNTKTPFDVDMGIGDVIIPKAETRKLPTQLPDFEKPVVMTYSLESTIAEKFDAIISRMSLSSRMKDYYDIFYLANTYSFDGRKLQEAIFETLQNRRTLYETDTFERVYGFIGDNDMQLKWKHFIKSTLKMEIEFTDVLNTMYSFLKPIFDAIINETELFEIWNPSLLKFERE